MTMPGYLCPSVGDQSDYNNVTNLQQSSTLRGSPVVFAIIGLFRAAFSLQSLKTGMYQLSPASDNLSSRCAVLCSDRRCAFIPHHRYMLLYSSLFCPGPLLSFFAPAPILTYGSSSSSPQALDEDLEALFRSWARPGATAPAVDVICTADSCDRGRGRDRIVKPSATGEVTGCTICHERQPIVLSISEEAAHTADAKAAERPVMKLGESSLTAPVFSIPLSRPCPADEMYRIGASPPILSSALLPLTMYVEGRYVETITLAIYISSC